MAPPSRPICLLLSSGLARSGAGSVGHIVVHRNRPGRQTQELLSKSLQTDGVQRGCGEGHPMYSSLKVTHAPTAPTTPTPCHNGPSARRTPQRHPATAGLCRSAAHPARETRTPSCPPARLVRKHRPARQRVGHIGVIELLIGPRLTSTQPRPGMHRFC